MDGNEHISWNPIRCFADVKTTPLVEDGVFGKKTEEMLEKFQKKYKLLVDGIYGVQSAAKMGSLLNWDCGLGG